MVQSLIRFSEIAEFYQSPLIIVHCIISTHISNLQSKALNVTLIIFANARQKLTHSGYFF